MMKTLQKTLVSFIISGLFAVSLLAQEGPIQSENLNQIEIDQIVKKLSKNEDEFRYALTNYVFDRSATVQTVGLGGLITGTFRRDSFLTFTKDGQRFEKIEYAPPSTLKEISITPQDLEDLGGVNPFAINPNDIELYTFSYVGKQKIDDLNLHVFDIRPKVIPNPKKTDKRLFVGRIWVDDEDLMIVKSKGKGIPETKENKFPVVETWRINVDGKYWFPAYTAADDDLVFDSGQVVKIRMRVRYDDYKQGRSEVIILDDEVEVKEEPAKDSGETLPPPLPKPFR